MIQLPDTSIKIKGQTIAVEKLEEICDIPDEFEGAIYQDAAGSFYVARLTPIRDFNECAKELSTAREPFGGEVKLPRDSDIIEAMRGQRLTVRRVTDKEALAWYRRHSMSDGPLKTLMAAAIKALFGPGKPDRAAKSRRSARRQLATVETTSQRASA
jgi:hypothetical protein